MKALQILQYGRNPKISNFQVPKYQADQVLIKVLYAPIHPADIYFFKGIYGIRKPLPSPVGFEGVGIIEKAEDEIIEGQYVSFMPSNDSQFGSWSQYCVVNKQDMIQVTGPISNLQLQKYSCAHINPFTSLGFFEIIKSGKYPNVLFSSCQSTVSKMTLRLLQKYYPEINLCALKRDLDQTNDLEFFKQFKLIDGVEEDLKNYFDKPVAYFDSHGGPMAGKILHSLPKNSKLISYGSSSMTHIGQLNPQDLIFQGKSLEGFWMNQFYDNLDPLKKDEMKKFIQNEITHGNIFETKITKVFKLDQILEALLSQKEAKGEGKIILDMTD